MCLHPFHEHWHVGVQGYSSPLDTYELSQGAVIHQAQAALLIAAFTSCFIECCTNSVVLTCLKHVVI